ncbi:MAG TPA: threonine--tRNA ligase [Polyangia bacterium]|nr:threonine--tRNA ligase [Polyangia bacterium]
MAELRAPKAKGDVPDDPLSRLRHSCSHVMADAVKRLFPGAKVAIGPSIETGFYYDFEVERPFSDEDLRAIEAEMGKIVAADLPFVREEISRDEALAMFRARGETYKVEIILGIPASETISLYRHGDFVDLCRGPHVERTGQIKAWKLLSHASAYWRGDERNQSLQRIYGTAFGSQKELDEFLHRLEEAKKRDHRVLGQKLDLFSIDDTIGRGLVLWHPRGGRVRYLIEEFSRREHLRHGYELVFTPHVARDELWKISGHLENYKENMFSGIDIEGQIYLVKPMNCPFHITIYKSHPRSYRDLPMRLGELGTVYRYERSGVLGGLLRVRGFTQDDAHLFCRRDQQEAELARCLDFCLSILRAFGFEDFKLFLATRSAELHTGALEHESEAALRKVLDQSGLPFEMDEGGGAFYGPKIDLRLRDAIGREWQCSTIQLDYALPERFGLEFTGSDGAKHRPVMIHRALYGSVERFFAVLVEHYAGAFPVWLSPVQVRVAPVSEEKHGAYARKVVAALRAADLRADADLSADKIGAKIRQAALEKIPYVLVVGDKEVVAGTVAPRERGGQQLEAMSLESFVERLRKEAAVPTVASKEERP